MIIIGGIMLLVFAVVLLVKRRAGLLLLGLLAGGTLSQLWAEQVVRYLGPAELALGGVPLAALVAFLITIAPMVVLLLSGSSHDKFVLRAVSAAIVAVFAVVVLLPVIGEYVVVEQVIMPVYEPLVAYRDVLLSAGVVYGVVDVFLARSRKVKE